MPPPGGLDGFWEGKLTLCMLGYFSCFCCRLLLLFLFFLSQFFPPKNSSINTIGVSNGLDPYQNRRSVGPAVANPGFLERGLVWLKVWG